MFGVVDTVILPERPPRDAPSCNYYVRRSDSTVWAVLSRCGRPSRAVGPLPPADQHEKRACDHDFEEGPRSVFVDARGWNLARDFIAAGKPWVLVLAPPPLPKGKPIIETDGRRAFRVGFSG